MKKPLAILLIFSLLSPYFVSAQSDPCKDKEFLRLKDVSINDMSDREYKYFMMMSEKCTDDVSATMQDNYEKEKGTGIEVDTVIWTIVWLALLYSFWT